MKLINAYTHPDAADVLWRLLAEREPYQSISHRNMPTVAEHRAFVASRPYPVWNLIDCGDLVGAVYLTDRNEVGIGILNRFKREGYASMALRMLMDEHPGPWLANIAPGNHDSIRLFVRNGFSIVQQTYKREAA